MEFGILETVQRVVPATIQLFASVTNVESTAHFKHSADGKTILAPQPSNSPNDPLNWSALRKDGLFAMLAMLLSTILAGVHGPVIAPLTLQLATEFDKDLTAIAQLSSYMLLVLAGTA